MCSWDSASLEGNENSSMSFHEGVGGVIKNNDQHTKKKSL